jgi:hypothetical protein
MPDEDAQAMRMTTPNLLAQGVESCQAAAVIVSHRYTWDLARLPTRDRIRRSLGRDYTLLREFPSVSDWGVVEVYVPRQPALCSGQSDE